MGFSQRKTRKDIPQGRVPAGKVECRKPADRCVVRRWKKVEAYASATVKASCWLGDSAASGILAHPLKIKRP